MPLDAAPHPTSTRRFLAITMTATKLIEVGVGEAAYTASDGSEPSMSDIMAAEVANATDNPGYFFEGSLQVNAEFIAAPSVDTLMKA